MSSRLFSGSGKSTTFARALRFYPPNGVSVSFSFCLYIPYTIHSHQTRWLSTVFSYLDSGSAKSTIFALALRFYRPTGGLVTRRAPFPFCFSCNSSRHSQAELSFISYLGSGSGKSTIFAPALRFYRPNNQDQNNPTRTNNISINQQLVQEVSRASAS